eukprot:evm.model.scf_18.33 EVM.evm.TU.scf_18.33   scf_18:223248-223685(-)
MVCTKEKVAGCVELKRKDDYEAADACDPACDKGKGCVYDEVTKCVATMPWIKP